MLNVILKIQTLRSFGQNVESRSGSTRIGIGIGGSDLTPSPELSDIMSVLLDQLDISWLDPDQSVTLDILKIISTFVQSFIGTSVVKTSVDGTSVDETSLCDVSKEGKVKKSENENLKRGFLTELVKGRTIFISKRKSFKNVFKTKKLFQAFHLFLYRKVI